MENTDHMFARAMRILALATFLLATAIFLLCYYFGGVFLMIGFACVIAGGIVNLSLFSITLSIGIKQRSKNLLMSAVMMILNAPVVAVYIWIVV